MLTHAYKLTTYTEHKWEEAIFLEKKSNKRIVHFRSTKFPARTLQTELPDNVPVDDFSMKAYLETIITNQSDVDSYSI